jgi:phosphoribosylanthranilate isomerase
MIRVKICGNTNLEDSLFCAKEGADALGFVFAPSPRKVEAEIVRQIVESLPPYVAAVGVFQNAPLEEVKWIKDYCRLGWVQLHGQESESYASHFYPFVIKTIFSLDEAKSDYPCSAYLWDRKKGSSSEFEIPGFLEHFPKPFILAGGITLETLEKVSGVKNLYGLDVTRGVEVFPGKKDLEKVKKFLSLAKGWSGPC